jgi:transcriptional regulator GlxA family with amidase domain
LRRQRLIFVYYDSCEVLDFAGPLQAFAEAEKYDLEHCGIRKSIRTAQGLEVSGLHPLPNVKAGDMIVIPGYPVMTGEIPHGIPDWLSRSHETGAWVCSVCTGAFALGEAGLLDGRQCTTHWKRIAELKKRYPTAQVVDDRLFVEDGCIMTSAGIATGIDMALAIIERQHGPRLAAKVAREMVVYLRRDGIQSQQSVYLDFRSHIHPGVHDVQDWLTSHPEKKADLQDLATIAHMSARNLTRSFRQATGISVGEYRTRLRLEHARSLIANPSLTVESIASECGFSDGRQLRRVWRRALGTSPRS